MEITQEELEMIAMCLQFCAEHHREARTVFDSDQEADEAEKLAKRLLSQIEVQPLVQ